MIWRDGLFGFGVCFFFIWKGWGGTQNYEVVWSLDSTLRNTALTYLVRFTGVKIYGFWRAAVACHICVVLCVQF